VPRQQNEIHLILNIEGKGMLTKLSAKLWGSEMRSQRVDKLELHHPGVVNKNRLKSNITGQIEATSLLAQPQLKSGVCSSKSSAARECPSKAFIEEHSKLNKKTKRTLTKSSVERERQARYEYLPV
jgi:hypothetical protein